VVMVFEVRAKARIDRRAVGQHRSRQSDDLARAAGRGDRASGVAAPLARKSPCRPQWAVICGARTVAATNSRPRNGGDVALPRKAVRSGSYGGEALIFLSSRGEAALE
jgi:hypothetical protein